MKLLVGLVTLICALAISGVACYFSVSGLAALFPAAAISVIWMGAVLETSKLVAAGWIHSNWNNKNVSWPHKTYLILACLALMIITSMGIYGYLAKAHLEASTPLAGIQIQVDQIQSKIDQTNADKNRLTQRTTMMDKSVESFLTNNKAKGGMAAQSAQKNERKDIQNKMDADDAQINQLTSQMAPLKLQLSSVDAKLGPLKYIAQLFGWKDPEVAVRMVIMILMVAFDPLAVVLMISGTITLGEWWKERNEKADTKEIEIMTEPERVPEIEENIVEEQPISEEQTETITEPEVRHDPYDHDEMMLGEDHEEPIVAALEDQKTLLIQILEKNPEFLNELIDAAEELKKQR